MIKINRILKNCEFTLESRHYQKIYQYYLISIIIELSKSIIGWSKIDIDLSLVAISISITIYIDFLTSVKSVVSLKFDLIEKEKKRS